VHVSRDPAQSLVVPFFLHLPWVVAQAMLPDNGAGVTARTLFWNSVILLGDFLVSRP